MFRAKLEPISPVSQPYFSRGCTPSRAAEAPYNFTAHIKEKRESYQQADPIPTQGVRNIYLSIHLLSSGIWDHSQTWIRLGKTDAHPAEVYVLFLVSRFFEPLRLSLAVKMRYDLTAIPLARATMKEYCQRINKPLQLQAAPAVSHASSIGWRRDLHSFTGPQLSSDTAPGIPLTKIMATLPESHTQAPVQRRADPQWFPPTHNPSLDGVLEHKPPKDIASTQITPVVTHEKQVTDNQLLPDGLGAVQTKTKANLNAVEDLTWRAAELELAGGNAYGVVSKDLKSLQAGLREQGAGLPIHVKHHLCYLYAVVWGNEGSFFAKATFADEPALYDRSYNMAFLLAAVHRMRTQVSETENNASAILALADFATELPLLPYPFQRLILGYLGSLPQSEQRDALIELLKGSAVGGAVSEEEASAAAQTDRLLQRLYALVMARGFDEQASKAVGAALATPQVFKRASQTQFTAFMAAAQNDPTVEGAILALAPEAWKSTLALNATSARQFRKDVREVGTEVPKCGIVDASQKVEGLRKANYWTSGTIPALGDLTSKRNLIHTITVRLQVEPQEASSESDKYNAKKKLRDARKEVLDESAPSERAVLSVDINKAVTSTPLPEMSLTQAFFGELAASLGLSSEIGHKLGEVTDKVGDFASNVAGSVVGFLAKLPEYMAKVKNSVAERIDFFKQSIGLLADNPEEYLGDAASELVDALFQPSTLAQVALAMAIMLVSNAALPGAGAGLSIFLLKVFFGAVGITQLVQALFGDLVDLANASDPKRGASLLARLTVRGLVGLLVLLGIRSLSKLKIKKGVRKTDPSAMKDGVERAAILRELTGMPDRIQLFVTQLRKGRLSFTQFAKTKPTAIGKRVQSGDDLLPQLDQLEVTLGGVAKKEGNGRFAKMWGHLAGFGEKGVGMLIGVKDALVGGLRVLHWLLAKALGAGAAIGEIATKAGNHLAEPFKNILDLPGKVGALMQATVGHVTDGVVGVVRKLVLAMGGKVGKTLNLLMDTSGDMVSAGMEEAIAPVRNAITEQLAPEVEALTKPARGVLDTLAKPVMDAFDGLKVSDSDQNNDPVSLLNQASFAGGLGTYGKQLGLHRGGAGGNLKTIHARFKARDKRQVLAMARKLPPIWHFKDWVKLYGGDDSQELKDQAREDLTMFIKLGYLRFAGHSYSGFWEDFPTNDVNNEPAFIQAIYQLMVRQYQIEARTRAPRSDDEVMIDMLQEYEPGLLDALYGYMRRHNFTLLPTPEILVRITDSESNPGEMAITNLLSAAHALSELPFHTMTDDLLEEVQASLRAISSTYSIAGGQVTAALGRISSDPNAAITVLPPALFANVGHLLTFDNDFTYTHGFYLPSANKVFIQGDVEGIHVVNPGALRHSLVHEFFHSISLPRFLGNAWNEPVTEGLTEYFTSRVDGNRVVGYQEYVGEISRIAAQIGDEPLLRYYLIENDPMLMNVVSERMRRYGWTVDPNFMDGDPQTATEAQENETYLRMFEYVMEHNNDWAVMMLTQAPPPEPTDNPSDE